MKERLPRLFFAAVLPAFAAGWLCAAVNPGRLVAGSSDRSGDTAVTTGPIAVDRSKQQGPGVPLEAVYVLNYSNGLLLAAVPTYEQSAHSIRVITDFAERDLVKDFGIAPGTRPRFLMTTLGMGLRSDGWAPLLVIEAESGQVATYRVVPQSASGSTRPSFQLVDRRSDPRLARSMAAAVSQAR